MVIQDQGWRILLLGAWIGDGSFWSNIAEFPGHQHCHWPGHFMNIHKLHQAQILDRLKFPF